MQKEDYVFDKTVNLLENVPKSIELGGHLKLHNSGSYAVIASSYMGGVHFVEPLEHNQIGQICAFSKVEVHACSYYQ